MDYIKKFKLNWEYFEYYQWEFIIKMHNNWVTFPESMMYFGVYEEWDLHQPTEEKLFEVRIFLRGHFEVLVYAEKMQFEWDWFLLYDHIVKAIATHVQKNWKELFPDKRHTIHEDTEETWKTPLIIEEI